MIHWRLIPVSSDRPILRAVLLLCVFACVAWAFWWHFERRMAALSHPSSPSSPSSMTQQKL